jgi:hypothetical protein
VRALRDQYLDTAQRYLSPGEANRGEAAALAWTNEIALGNAQILTQNLLLRQMDRDLDRFDQKEADDVAYYLYRGVTTLAGREWRGARRIRAGASREGATRSGRGRSRARDWCSVSLNLL